MTILLTVIITIIAYSTILSIVCIYKDISKYNSLDEIDIIVAGPVQWLLFGLFFIIRKIVDAYNKKNKKSNKTKKPKKRKEYTDKQIEKIVRKVIRIYKRKHYVKWVAIDNNLLHELGEYSGIYHIKDLRPRSALHELLEDKYLYICDKYPEKAFEVIKSEGTLLKDSKLYPECKSNFYEWQTEKVENNVVEI